MQEPLEDKFSHRYQKCWVDCFNNVYHTDNAEVCHHCYDYTQVIMLITDVVLRIQISDNQQQCLHLHDSSDCRLG